MQVLTLDTQNYTLGESKNPLSLDGGFSSTSYGINLFKTKNDGGLHGQPTATQRGSGTIVDSFIASIIDERNLGNDGGFHVDNTGNYYTLDGGTVTKKQTDASGTYTLGTTDLKLYQSNTYATTATDVVLLTGDLATIDATWWSVTRGHGTMTNGYRHPIAVVEDTEYIADGNKINTWDGTTSVANALTLPTDVNITKLIKHPDGRNLVAFTGVGQNFSHTLGNRGRVYIIDTLTLEWVKEIEVEAQVEGAIVNGGTIYVTYGKTFGYFNGSGLEWLYTMKYSETTYSHSIDVYEDAVIFRDGIYVVAYADVGSGRTFFKVLKSVASTDITTVLYVGASTILYSYDVSGTGYLQEIDLTSEGYYYLVTHPLQSIGRVWIRRIELEHDNNNSTWTEFIADVLGSDGSAANLGTLEVKAAVDVTRSRLDTNYLLENGRLVIRNQTNTLPIYKINIYYEPAE